MSSSGEMYVVGDRSHVGRHVVANGIRVIVVRIRFSVTK